MNFVLLLKCQVNKNFLGTGDLLNLNSNFIVAENILIPVSIALISLNKWQSGEEGTQANRKTNIRAEQQFKIRKL